MNENDNKQVNKTNKIIITASVIIIFAFVAISIILIIINGEKQRTKNTNRIEQEDNIVAENDIQEEAISNETIIDDTNVTLNKSYGKIDIVFIDENNKIISEPEKPAIGDELTPVKYNNSSFKFEKTAADDETWYDYSNKIWANAVDSNSNYFVWIPRFAYKITYYSDSTYTHKIGYSDSRGILVINEDNSNTLTRIAHNSSGLQEVGNHYIVEPAFMNDSINSYRNGGWSSNITGFWVAKYEMSNETDLSNSNLTTSNSIKLASKPCKTSLRNIDIGDAYYNSYYFNRALESHLMKNSEWGAIAYLSYSKYGTNSYKISNNNSKDYITGGSTIETEVYNTNKTQTTTQNVYGVYDLSGGASEYIAAYINNSNQYLVYGKNGEGYLLSDNSNTKYKTIYSNTNEEQSYTERNGTLNYKSNSLKRGDAIFETSMNGYQSTSWNTNSSFFMQYDVPFMVRGGTFADSVSAGLFNYNACNGQANASESFRVCLTLN